MQVLQFLLPATRSSERNMKNPIKSVYCVSNYMQKSSLLYIPPCFLCVSDYHLCGRFVVWLICSISISLCLFTYLLIHLMHSLVHRKQGKHKKAECHSVNNAIFLDPWSNPCEITSRSPSRGCEVLLSEKGSSPISYLLPLMKSLTSISFSHFLNAL